MKKKFSIGTNQSPVLITLLSIVVLAAIYLFVYIPQNEVELKEQRFRSLQRVADNVHKKIDNSTSLMDGLLKASFDKSLELSKVDNYIKEYDTSNFRLFPIESAIDTALRKEAKKKNISPIFSDAEDGTVAIKVNEATRKFRLYYAKRFPKNIKNDTCVYMSMLYNFDDFIKPLLPVNVFDKYVVFSKGNVVYENFASGLSYTNKDSLLGVHNTVAGSAIRDQEISGIKYKFFLQPVGFDLNNEWIIGGLLRDDRYNAEKKQLPANLVLFLMITAIVIIILLPWIKLFQMGSRDRLTLYDGGMSFFVAMLLTSMLFFILLWANAQFHSTETIQSEKNLSKNIATAFQGEITKAYNQIYTFDNLRYSDKINASIIKLRKDKGSFIDLYSHKEKAFPDSIQKVTSLIDSNLSINQVFWLDSNGHDTYSWTKDEFYPPPGDFSKRGYFKNIINANCLFLEGDTLKPFYIEPVVSWTSGTFRTVISIPSKLKDNSVNKEAVGAVSINIKSLDNVVMPAGCQFAITDDKGNVLYHYYIGRNLNENLLEEFSEKSELKGAYEAHAEKSFITDYYSKQYDVYVSPLKGLPYFLLILTDKSLMDTSSIEIFGTTLSLTFIFFFFQFMLIIIIVLAIIFSKQSSLKNWSLAASWLWPKKSVHNEYIVTIFYNILIIILEAVFFARGSFAQNCFMLLPAVSFVIICFNTLLAKRYRKEGRLKYYTIKKRVIICIGLLVVVINFLAIKVLDIFFCPFLFFQIAALVLLLLIILFKGYILKFVQIIVPASIGTGRNYIYSYALLAFTYFIISSGIPMILFYVSSFNYEQNLLMRYQQVEFAKKVIEKDAGRNAFVNIQGVYNDSVWIGFDSVTANIPPLTAFSSEDLSSAGILNRFRFYANDVSSATQYLNVVNTPDYVFFLGSIFSHTPKISTDSSIKLSSASSGIFRDSLSTTSVKTSKGQYLNITSPTLRYRFINTSIENSIFMLLLFGLICLFFYFLIYKIIRKIFALDLPDIDKWQQLDTAIINSEKLNDHVLIIGSPGSGKLKKLREKIKKQEIKLDGGSALIFDTEDPLNNNVYIADFINIPVAENWNTKNIQNIKWEAIKAEAKNDKHKLIIIDHFGYNMNHPKTNNEKLSFLEELMMDDQNKKEQYQKIIILSTVHPYIFLDSLNAQQNNATDYNLQRWIEVLGHFRIIIYPLEHTNLQRKIGSLKNYLDEFKNVSMENPAGVLPKEGIIVERIENALKAVENFMNEKKIKNALSLATKYYAELNAEIHSVISDIESISETNKTSACSGLLWEIKEVLKEILVYVKESLSESGQKVLKETMHTHFLNKLQQTVGEIRGNKYINTDSLSLKMELTSQHYYMYIWNSLTKEEKFILYDLAEDGLVNTHDIFNLTMLIGKGLILRDNDRILKVFNKSFRNFIINSIGYNESQMIRKEIKENGNWSKLKTPMLIVSLATLALVIISQHEAYTKVVGYLTVLVTAVIPFLQKAFSLFDKEKTKS